MVRTGGILMHVSSLPSPFGIGTFGRAAYDFVDFLEKSGVGCWQVLPLGPTAFGDSPYQSYSTFAGNPYLIDLEFLGEEDLLQKGDYQSLSWGIDGSQVDYDIMREHRLNLLRKAYKNYMGSDALQARMGTGLNAFSEKKHSWVYDYGIYMAAKNYFGGTSWTEWPDVELIKRNPDTLGYYWNLLQDEIRFWIFVQYLFFKQWSALKKYANEKNIKIIGDIPIYVAMDSVDVWANPQLFCLDSARKPLAVAGCPPDYFSQDGQLWGNPVYDWEIHRQEGYHWWLSRLGESLEMFDILRIDHFRGFEAFYVIPADAENAKAGKWIKGPGMEFIRKVKERFGEGRIIAEDLGLITEDVKTLLRDSGFPGMKVLQFAFDIGEESDYLPHKYEKNCVVYTGTHDNTTLSAFLHLADADVLKFAEEYFKLTKKEGYARGFIRGALSSVADLAVIPMQDYLELPAWARMNEPSTVGGNWQWRVSAEMLTDELAESIMKLNVLYGRNHPKY